MRRYRTNSRFWLQLDPSVLLPHWRVHRQLLLQRLDLLSQKTAERHFFVENTRKVFFIKTCFCRKRRMRERERFIDLGIDHKIRFRFSALCIFFLVNICFSDAYSFPLFLFHHSLSLPTFYISVVLVGLSIFLSSFYTFRFSSVYENFYTKLFSSSLLLPPVRRCKDKILTIFTLDFVISPITSA